MSSKKIPEPEEHFRNLYRTMKKAGLSKDFLQSNSATHSFLLGAMAEIIDNAKDADSTHLDIGMESFNGKDALTFLDNGKGMNPEELNNVIKIGYMQKDDRKVGRYGNGLKAGSMRLAHECLVLTKKQPAEGSPGSRSALLLSRSFLEKNGLDEVHVAMPSFELDSDKPLVGDDDEVHGADEVLHNTETEVIASYCGLKDMAQLFTLFDRIKVQGTLVILFNLRREVTGEPELNWTTDPEDIWTRDPENTPLERTSLREYLRMLYYEPTMTVNLRGRPVLLQRPVSELYMANAYPWKPRNMQHAKDIEIKRRQEVVDKMKEDHNVLKEEYGKLLSTPVSSEAERRENEKKRRLLGDRIADRDKEIAEADEQLRSKQKATVEERIYCGFYPYKRKIAGALIYINGRLVEAVPFLDCQKKNPELLKGLTTVVNLSIKVLIPTTNKQGLESTKDRATLLKAMNETMRYHFDEVILKQLGKEPGKFLFEMWQSFGCPTDDAVFEQKRDKPTLEAIHRSVGHTVLCRNCLQWKRLPTSLYTSLLSNEENIVGWKCQLHPNTSKRSCGIPDTNLDPAMKTLIPLTARREPRPPTSSLSFRPSTSAQSDANEQKPETEALNRLSEMFTIPKKSRDRPISSIVPARVLDHVRPKAAPPDTTKASPAVPPRISPRKVRVIEEEEEVLEVPPRRHVPVPWNGSARNRVVETEEVAPGVSRKGARAGRPSLTKKAVVIEEEEEEPEPMVETPSQRSSRRNGDSLHRVVEEEEVPETSRRSTRTPSKKRHVVEEDDEEEILEKRRINGVANRGEENKVPMMDDGDTSQEIVHGVTSFELEMMLSQLVNHGVPKSWGRRKFRTMTEDYADLAKACSQEASRRA